MNWLTDISVLCGDYWNFYFSFYKSLPLVYDMQEYALLLMFLIGLCQVALEDILVYLNQLEFVMNYS